jgi:hypothetical protein
VAFTWGIINALRVDQQGWFNNFAMFWQIVCTFLFVVVVLSLQVCMPFVVPTTVLLNTGRMQGNNGTLNSSSFVWTLWNKYVE